MKSWQKTRHGLYKRYNFANFTEAFDFMTRVAAVANKMNHHPRWENNWGVVQVWLITHEGRRRITNKDWRLAEAIDAVFATRKSPTDGVQAVAASGVALQSAMAPADQQRATYVKLFSDGGSRGNPGPSAAGFVLLDANDTVLVDQGVYLGVTTNNQAEYMALKLALEAALKLGVREVDCYLDSLLVVNQMRGIFKIKNRDLWPVHDAIKDLVSKFKKVHFTHVPREHNKLADAAVNRALDEHLSGARTSELTADGASDAVSDQSTKT